MANLDAMLKQVDVDQGRVDAIDATRRKIVDAFDADPAPGSVAAVTEALYRLGLTALLVHKNLDEAQELFKRAAEKKQPEWSPQARTSYGLVLHARGKHQQAVFELRKAVQPGAPTPTTGTALVFLCQVLRDMKAKPSEIEKADAERIAALDGLVKAHAEKGPDRAHWLMLFATAHKEGGSRSEAKKALQEVVAMGASAGEPTLGTARDLLKGM